MRDRRREGRRARCGLPALALALLAGCAAAPGPGPTAPPPTGPAAEAFRADLPAGDTAWSNDSLAALFATLVFEAEWGARRERLVRLEPPLTVALDGPGAEAHAAFLAEYLAYLRTHAGLDIARARGGAALTIRLVPGDAFRALLPGAACTLVPGARDWEAYAADPARLGGRALIAAERLEAVTIFVPGDAAPYRIRACLLEEIAQGLGPINDLYGLSDSIFNDDFAHLWPTRLDLLMLRLLYAPGMETGLSRAEAERRARAVLDRINPVGRRARDLPPVRLAGGARWRALVARVTARGTPGPARRRAAAEALAIAGALAPDSPWHCHSLTLAGRLALEARPGESLDLLRRALGVCAEAHGAGDIRLPQLQLQVLRALLATDRPVEALARTAGLARPLAGHGLDAGLATLYALEARAARATGDAGAAAGAAARARAWGARAFGPAPAAPIDWF